MAQLGMFGGAAPRLRRYEDPYLLYQTAPQPQPAEEDTARIPFRRRATASSVLGAPEQGAPAGPPPMGMFGTSAKAAKLATPKTAIPMADENSGYTPGKRDWMKEIGSDPLGFLLTGTDGLSNNREEAILSDYARKAEAKEQERLRTQNAMLDQMGVTGRERLAYWANPEKYGESYATNLEAADINGGDSRSILGANGVRSMITAPKFGVDGGYGYKQTADGIEWGDQRGQNHDEVTAEGTLDETGRHNRATEGVLRDRLAYDRSKPQAGSGLTPYQGLNFQFKLDDLDRELADKERTRKTSLATVDGSIALLDKFTGGGATFNDVYGNWINPTGEGNDLFNPRVQPGSPRANGTAILEQLGGRAFLDSIQAMRGTGPLSDREGARVTAAATRLTNVTQSDEAATEAATEFRAALEAYKAALEQDMATSRESEATRRNRMEAMMGVAAGSPAAASPVDDLSDLLEKYK